MFSTLPKRSDKNCKGSYFTPLMTFLYPHSVGFFGNLVLMVLITDCVLILIVPI